MAVGYGELGNQIFAAIFIENEVFLSGGSCKEIDFDLFVVFVGEGYFVVIGDAGIGFGLFVLVSFFVVVILIMNRVV